MSQVVIYNTISGVISGTLFNQPGLPPQSQLDAWAALGNSASLQPDSPIIDGSKGIFVNGNFQPYSAPNPIPSISIQLVAALINNGTVDVSAFHPTTIAMLNTALADSSLQTVTIATSTTSTAAPAP